MYVLLRSMFNEKNWKSVLGKEGEVQDTWLRCSMWIWTPLPTVRLIVPAIVLLSLWLQCFVGPVSSQGHMVKTNLLIFLKIHSRGTVHRTNTQNQFLLSCILKRITSKEYPCTVASPLKFGAACTHPESPCYNWRKQKSIVHQCYPTSVCPIQALIHMENWEPSIISESGFNMYCWLELTLNWAELSTCSQNEWLCGVNNLCCT